MSRYIDADLIEYHDSFTNDGEFARVAFGDDIDVLPTADVVEVVHGYWKGKPIAGYCTVRCSACRSAFLDNDGRWNYCPNCGADMRGGRNEQIY